MRLDMHALRRCAPRDLPLAHHLLKHPLMINLPPAFPPLPTSTPLAFTITVGWPALWVVALVAGALIVVFGAIALGEYRTRRRASSLPTPTRRRIALRLSAGGASK